MALFSKGRGKSSGRADYAFRGRNSGPGRGKGRGRKRADEVTMMEIKDNFNTTRVESQLAETSENGAEESSLEEGHNAEEALGFSSESEDDMRMNAVLPYSSLLQSLNADPEHGAPQRKKRKLGSIGAPNPEQVPPKVDLDEVEEPEEAEDLGMDVIDVDQQEQELDLDPFLEHLDPDNGLLEKQVQALRQNKWTTTKSSPQSKCYSLLKIPDVADIFPESCTETVPDVENLSLKQKLKGPATNQKLPFDNLTKHLAYSLFHYRDILFPHRTLQNSDILRRLTCLHILNHVLKTRDRIIKDNARLAKEDAEEDLELRDQGFTRPKVLVLLPTRHACVNYVENLASLYEPEQQENKKRFQDSFAGGEQVSSDKPPDFRELFSGNDDDMFRLGLKFTRKTIKFFAHFYNSDIIFASPLGLRMALGSDDAKKQDNDFLSSIEIVVMDQADSILMQNWEHVEYIFDRLNLQPKEAHGCDFSRVRNWYLDGNAKYLRQTVLLSAFNFPSLNKLYTQHMLNVAGKVKYSRDVDGAMTDFDIPLKRTFSRFDSGIPATEPENRFEYFTRAVVPSLTKPSRHAVAGGQGVLIYLPAYAEFVRIRNYLATSSATQDISFGSISEYTSVRDVARARSHFSSGRHSVLLYTERAHHFRRYHLKGVKRVIMYGLPENPIFYKEVVGGFLAASIAAAQSDAKDSSVRALFSRLDLMKLERVVGSSRYLFMLKDKSGDTFDFV